jgi:hypothetical protein
MRSNYLQNSNSIVLKEYFENISRIFFINLVKSVFDKQLLSILASFEDKRKENYDKGQAELDRRRKTLADIQKKEQVSRKTPLEMEICLKLPNFRTNATAKNAKRTTNVKRPAWKLK